MAWVKLDDGFADHPKFLDLDLAGVGLWSQMLAYCGRYLTDGLVTRSALLRIAPHVKEATKRRLVAELVRRELLVEVADGWIVHDYLDWNPSAEETKARRRERAEAGRRGGRASGQARAKATALARGEPTAKATASATGEADDQARGLNPVPSRPVPYATTSPLSTKDPQAVDLGESEDRVSAALERLADEDLAHSKGAGTVRGPDGPYRAACLERRIAEDRAGLAAIAAERPDATVDQIIAAHMAERYLAG